jgi:hypothetical protein
MDLISAALPPAAHAHLAALSVARDSALASSRAFALTHLHSRLRLAAAKTEERGATFSLCFHTSTEETTMIQTLGTVKAETKGLPVGSEYPALGNGQI